MNQDRSNEPASARRRQAAIPFILLTLFIDILGIGIIIPVLPNLIKEFTGDSTTLASWYYGIIATTYSLMQFVFAPIVGALSDRFGRRPVILASLFGLAVDFIITGLAPNLAWLFIGRIFAGIFGASITTANAYIADVSTPETRARNYGLVGIMFGLGFICGPTLGGILGDYSLRLPFFVSAGLAIVNWMYGFFILPESLPASERNSFSLARANPIGTLRTLRAYPIVWGVAAAFACMSLAQRGLENVWVLYTGERYGWDTAANGRALGLVGLMAVVVQGGLIRPAIKRLGERGAVLVGLAISSIAFLGYGLASEDWMIPCIIVFGSLGGLTGPAIQSIVAGSVKSNEQGNVQGALTSLMSLTNVIAPLVFVAGVFSFFTKKNAKLDFFGQQLNVPYLPGAPFFIGSVLLVIALLICRSAFRRIPELQTESPSNSETEKAESA
ncbi:MAG: TCR/Tet family MFS transporter [Planctomycetales bacterium]|nr:TCR/Tet family MFS transporter [Planctomycetales bacterium]